MRKGVGLGVQKGLRNFLMIPNGILKGGLRLYKGVTGLSLGCFICFPWLFQRCYVSNVSKGNLKES